MIDKEYIQKFRSKALQEVKKYSSEEQYKTIRNNNINPNDQPGYIGSTYLYIRAFEGDNGSRPISPDTVFWLSPDIKLFDASGEVISTTISANNTYHVKVTVRNDGDHDCNSCMVDLYIDDPSIGFCMAASKLIGIQTVSVNGHSQTVVDFQFTATNDMSGHKCLFARAYCLVTNDFPEDFANFKTFEDRHIGQHNLTIIKQGNSFYFNVNKYINLEQTNFEVFLKTDKKVFKENTFVLGKYKMINKTIETKNFVLNDNKIVRTQPNSIRSKILRLDLLQPVIKKLFFSKEVVNQPVKDMWVQKLDVGINSLKIDIPVLGLKEDEAAPMNVLVRDPQTGNIIGGITLLIVG